MWVNGIELVGFQAHPTARVNLQNNMIKISRPQEGGTEGGWGRDRDRQRDRGKDRDQRGR